jgi:hypothetical protein
MLYYLYKAVYNTFIFNKVNFYIKINKNELFLNVPIFWGEPFSKGFKGLLFSLFEFAWRRTWSRVAVGVHFK